MAKKFKNPWAKGGEHWNESVLSSKAVDQNSTAVAKSQDVPGATLDFECYKDLLNAWTGSTKGDVVYDLAPQFLNLEKSNSLLELDQVVTAISGFSLGHIYEFQGNCQCCGILIAVEGQDPNQPFPKGNAIIEYLQTTPSKINTGGANINDFKNYDFDMSFDEMLIIGIVVTPPIIIKTKNNSFPIRMMIKSGDCCPT